MLSSQPSTRRRGRAVPSPVAQRSELAVDISFPGLKGCAGRIRLDRLPGEALAALQHITEERALRRWLRAHARITLPAGEALKETPAELARRLYDTLATVVCARVDGQITVAAALEIGDRLVRDGDRLVREG